MPPPNAPSQLHIDLAALRENYSILKEQSETAKVSAVVKADAYGLGTEPVVKALWAEGCRTFFTAHLDEAIRVRAVLPQAEVGVLNGLLKGEEKVYRQYNLMPTLNDPGQISLWSDYSHQVNTALPASLQVDTGMSRLGLSPTEFHQLSTNLSSLDDFDLRYLLSHLACAETPHHELNRQQLERFQTVIRHIPGSVASLAASSGIFLGREWHFDMLRPGVALYGGNPTPERNNPMKQVINLKGKILQIREIDAPETVGYGAYYKATGPTRIATLAAGYADGYLRTLSDHSHVMYQGKKLPVVGRVSMDLITVDITEAKGLKVGDLVDMIGPGMDINDLAEHAGTIPYEILTNLGNRYARIYSGE